MNPLINLPDFKIIAATFTPSIILLLALSLLVSIYYLLFKSRASTEIPTPPEASGAWPIIGHLPVIGGSTPAHIALGKLADKHGPIFSLRLGVHRAVIVSDSEIAREFYTTHDKVFANRPTSIGGELMGYDNTMFGLSPYGPYWREIRRIATVELLSNHRLQSLCHIRESEVKMAVREIYDSWMKKKDRVDMKKWFMEITLNSSLRMVVGKRNDSDQISKAVRDFFRLVMTFVLGDAIPWLRWLDIGGEQRSMKISARKLDELVQTWLDEHRVSRDENDFMGVMLSFLDGGQEVHDHSGDRVIKSTCLALILGGTDTSMVTLTWALTLLLNSPDTLKKVQRELDEQVGRDRQVNESDIKNLVYLEAVFKETLRLYPSSPMLVPHESTEDCTVAGYKIPARTRLMVNASKIHRDPKYWSDPKEFIPERFLSTHKDINVRGQHYEFIPFGSGRRICPAISLALQVTHLTLASLLHSFDITAASDESLDMSESPGLTNLKASPLDVLVTPRLLAEAY